MRGTHLRMGQENGNTLAEREHGLVSFGDAALAPPIALAAAQGPVGDGVHAPVMHSLVGRTEFPRYESGFYAAEMQFSMPTLQGAKGYRGEIAMDAGFAQLLAPISAEDELIKISGLAEGEYWLRLRAVDEHGLQGMTSTTRFVVKQHVAAPAMKIALKPTSLSFVGNRLLIDWQGEPGLNYQCQMSASHDFSFPLVDIIVKNNELSIPTPDKGRYFVRVRGINVEGVKGDWSEELAFDVR